MIADSIDDFGWGDDGTGFSSTPIRGLAGGGLNPISTLAPIYVVSPIDNVFNPIAIDETVPLGGASAPSGSGGTIYGNAPTQPIETVIVDPLPTPIDTGASGGTTTSVPDSTSAVTAGNTTSATSAPARIMSHPYLSLAVLLLVLWFVWRK